jgi:hypothetical protein
MGAIPGHTRSVSEIDLKIAQNAWHPVAMLVGLYGEQTFSIL